MELGLKSIVCMLKHMVIAQLLLSKRLVKFTKYSKIMNNLYIENFSNGNFYIMQNWEGINVVGRYFTHLRFVDNFIPTRTNLKELKWM